MKFLKGVSLFFLYPCIMLGSGIYIGILLNNYFYPRQIQYIEVPVPVPAAQTNEQEVAEEEEISQSDSAAVLSREKEVIDADTEYIVEEYDTRRDTLVETVWNVPPKYMGSFCDGNGAVCGFAPAHRAGERLCGTGGAFFFLQPSGCPHELCLCGALKKFLSESGGQ